MKGLSKGRYDETFAGEDEGRLAPQHQAASFYFILSHDDSM